MKPDTRKLIFALVLTSVVAATLSIPVFLVQSGHYDTQHHILAARQLVEHGRIVTPHFLFHGMLALIHSSTGITYESGAVFVQILFALLYASLGFLWLNSFGMRRELAILLVLSSFLYNPLTAFFPIDHHLYFGYLYVNVFHNPTIWTLRPFALALVMLTLKLEVNGSFKLSDGFLTLTLAILACLAKPSFTIVFLPGMLLWLSIRRAKTTVWQGALWILLPSLACLVFQYSFAYGDSAAAAGIAWQPLTVMGLFSHYLAIKFVLSLAFPLAVLALFPERALHWPPLQLTWLIFFFGAFLAYLLNETGARADQGNFIWSAQISLLLLFFCSAALLAKERLPLNWRTASCWGLFIAHLLNGAVFYLTELMARQMQYW